MSQCIFRHVYHTARPLWKKCHRRGRHNKNCERQKPIREAILELVIISVKRRTVTELDLNKHQPLPEIPNEFRVRSKRWLGLPAKGSERHGKCLVVPGLVVIDNAVFSMVKRLFPIHTADYGLGFAISDASVFLS